MTSFTTKEPVRIMFPQLTKPRKQMNGQEKFGVLVLVHKESLVFEQIRETMAEVMRDRFGQIVKLKGRANPIKSCAKVDAERVEEGKEAMFSKLDNAADYVYFNAKSSDRPGIVDRNIEPVGALDVNNMFKSGTYVNLSLDVYPWKQEHGQGLSIGLNHVQFVKDGETLATGSGGSRPDVNKAFDGLGGKVDVADFDDNSDEPSDQDVADMFG